MTKTQTRLRGNKYPSLDKRGNGKYNYNLMARVYLEGNYTFKDLEYIFGAVNGGISKKFDEMGIPSRRRDLIVNQKSPKVFSEELIKALQEESIWAYKNRKIKVNYLERIDNYYKKVCLVDKILEVNIFHNRQMTSEDISMKYDRFGVKAVEEMLSRFKLSEKDIITGRESVRNYLEHFKKSSQSLRNA